MVKFANAPTPVFPVQNIHLATEVTGFLYRALLKNPIYAINNAPISQKNRPKREIVSRSDALKSRRYRFRKAQCHQLNLVPLLRQDFPTASSAQRS